MPESEPEEVADVAVDAGSSGMPLCFICGSEADGKLEPECRKCGMTICRQHRDKNGFFNQYYTCFPCCRPEAQRVPWRDQVKRAREESARRKRQERVRVARDNGVGDDCLPVRAAAAGAAENAEHLPARVVGPRPPKLGAGGPAAVVEKVAVWQEELKTPTPSCSPGAGRDAPGSTNVVELWANGLAQPPPVSAPPRELAPPYATVAANEEHLPMRRAQPAEFSAARRLEMHDTGPAVDDDGFVDAAAPLPRPTDVESPRNTAPPSPAPEESTGAGAPQRQTHADAEHLPVRATKRTYTFSRRT